MPFKTTPRKCVSSVLFHCNESNERQFARDRNHILSRALNHFQPNVSLCEPFSRSIPIRLPRQSLYASRPFSPSKNARARERDEGKERELSAQTLIDSALACDICRCVQFICAPEKVPISFCFSHQLCHRSDESPCVSFANDHLSINLNLFALPFVSRAMVDYLA